VDKPWAAFNKSLKAMVFDRMPDQEEFLETEFDSFGQLIKMMSRAVSSEEYLRVVDLIVASFSPESAAAREGVTTDLNAAPFFHFGDLHIDGDLVFYNTFVVTGDLSISGCLVDSYPESSLMVGGNLRARSVFSEGEINVGGKLSCSDVAYIYYNGALVRAELLQARLVIEAGPRIGSPIEGEHVFAHDDYEQGHAEGVNDQLRKILIPSLFNGPDCDPGHLSEKNLLKHLRAGDDVFLP